MKLKIEGKLKDGFFEWLEDDNKFEVDSGYFDIGGTSCYTSNKLFFEASPQSAQFGLIQEWGDSVGYYLEMVFLMDEYIARIWSEKHGWDSLCNITCNSRPEAQREAVKKLSEIYNK